MKRSGRSSRIGSLWRYLAGSKAEFSMENRAFNSISVITFVLLIILMSLNIFVRIPNITLTTSIMVILQAILYYFSRYRKKFHISIIVYAIVSYLALIVVYYQNCGINGPTIFCFFISFHLLIALTPNRLHIIWVMLHVLIPGAMMIYECMHPSFVPYTYPSRFSRFLDINTTYIVTILLIYCVTFYLRSNYKREKRIAESRADMIGEQTQKLDEIAWMQSHMLRNHAATILGLAQLFNNEDPADPLNQEILQKITEATRNLDDSIKEIDAKTKID